jgi:hypothetical protein
VKNHSFARFKRRWNGDGETKKIPAKSQFDAREEMPENKRSEERIG